jgi:orotidine-5'-phosphate decarboxylase
MVQKTKIILAYDSNTFTTQDQDLLTSIIQHIFAVKVGLQSYTALDEQGVSTAYKVEKFCGGVAMRDWKLYDIGNTVTKALENILTMGTGMVTLHALIKDEALKAVASLCKGKKVTPLAVTVLTDLTDAQCYSRFRRSSKKAVLDFATKTIEAGIRGIVCSPKEVDIIRKELGSKPMLVIPGIRPAWAQANDQARTMTPGEAAKAGANYIVIGRPVLNPPNGMTPLQAIESVAEELDKAT